MVKEQDVTNHRPIVELFRKYVDGTITPAELEELSIYLDNSKPGDELTEWLHREMERKEGAHDDLLLNTMVDHVEKTLFEQTMPVGDETTFRPKQGTRVGRVWLKAVAAAVLVCALAVGGMFWQKETNPEALLASVDIAPGGHRAQLVLPNGKTIDLQGEHGGIAVGNQLTYLDGTAILGVDGQQGTEATDKQHGKGEEQLLILSTPRGGMYQIKLADGTMVWLNAGSTLRYPTLFNGTTRTVELSGEGYFEVARNEKQPFVVKTKGQTVNVLGTAFNINAYDDEVDVKTTLVNGSVELLGESPVSAIVMRGTKNVVLKPGQQAVQRDGDMQVVQVDVNDHIAWKNGRFVFYGVAFPGVLRQIERWYDVSFEYEELPVDIELWGGISRDVMLSEILEAIEMNTAFDVKQQGRRVIMQKK